MLLDNQAGVPVPGSERWGSQFCRLREGDGELAQARALPQAHVCR